MQTKTNITLSAQQVKELNAIERETDRPRVRIIRRAIEEWLLRYRAANPEFAAKYKRDPEDDEVEPAPFKAGIETDTVIIRGKKVEVVITSEGWRLPTPEDRESDPVSGKSVSILEGGK